MDASERRLDKSGIEQLMGSVWKPHVVFGNAIFDALDVDDQRAVNLKSIYITSFKDPIFETYRKVWIDHILYSLSRPKGWISNAAPRHTFAGNQPNTTGKIWDKYPHISDHFPVTAQIDTSRL